MSAAFSKHTGRLSYLKINILS